MSRVQKSRVTVDFPIPERDILELLCEQDLRPAAEQLRWLVRAEADRREFPILHNDNSAAATLAGKSDAVAHQSTA